MIDNLLHKSKEIKKKQSWRKTMVQVLKKYRGQTLSEAKLLDKVQQPYAIVDYILIKKKRKFSSYLRKFRVKQLQSNI